MTHILLSLTYLQKLSVWWNINWSLMYKKSLINRPSPVREPPRIRWSYAWCPRVHWLDCEASWALADSYVSRTFLLGHWYGVNPYVSRTFFPKVQQQDWPHEQLRWERPAAGARRVRHAGRPLVARCGPARGPCSPAAAESCVPPGLVSWHAADVSGNKAYIFV